MRTQLCLTLCSPMDCSPQIPLSMEFSRQECWSGLPLPECSQGELPYSIISKMNLGVLSLLCACVCTLSHFSRVRLFATPWTTAHQAPPSMGFSRQEYWSGLPFPSPGDLPYPGIEPWSPAFQADALTSEPAGKSLYLKSPQIKPLQ